MGRRGLSRRAKLALSVLLALHVTAVFLGPFAMGPDRSALASLFYSVLGPYTRALSLDNGYRFFAPEPGPSHLIRYELTGADGRQIEGEFPHLATQQPRLLYHRHFMLTEFMNLRDGQAPDEPLEESPEGELAPAEAAAARREREAWRRARSLRDRCLRSYAAHLLARYDAVEASLYLRRHNIPWPADVAGGMSLDDPRLFEEKLLGTFTRDGILGSAP